MEEGIIVHIKKKYEKLQRCVRSELVIQIISGMIAKRLTKEIE